MPSHEWYTAASKYDLAVDVAHCNSVFVNEDYAYHIISSPVGCVLEFGGHGI